jgi:hypothetical protein
MDCEKINAAAQSLLTACFEDDDPVERLHAELENFRASGHFSEIELRRIQELTLTTAKVISGQE